VTCLSYFMINKGLFWGDVAKVQIRKVLEEVSRTAGFVIGYKSRDADKMTLKRERKKSLCT
jgi:hypothetical protein